MELRKSNAHHLDAQTRKSEVGEIPVDWEIKRLGDFCSIRAGGDVDLTRFSPNETQRHPYPIWANARSASPYGYSSAFQFPGNSLTVTARGDIGHAVYRDRPYCAAGRLLALIPKTLASAHFIAEFINECIKFATESAGIPQLTEPQIANCFIAIPSDALEINNIAIALSNTDSLIDLLSQLLIKKRRIKKGAMQELLTGKHRLAGFSSLWRSMTMDKAFDFGGGLSASRDQLGNVGACYLHYGDIHLSNKTYIDLDIEHHKMPQFDTDIRKVSPSALLKDGDVVFVDASENIEGVSKHVVIHNCANRPLISGLHTITAKPKADHLVNLYKRYCFQSFEVQAQFRFYAAGTKVSGISKRNIGKIVLKFPSIDEQIEIANFLASLDAEIDALNALLIKTHALKKAMAQALLTGRIRLLEPTA